MSYIIDQTFNSCQNTFSANQIDGREILSKSSAVQLIRKQLDQYLNKLGVQYLTEFIQPCFTEANLSTKIIFKNVGIKYYDFLATIIFNIQNRTVQIQVTAIDSSFPYKIQSFHQRILACKLFSKNSSKNTLNKVIISIQNGGFKVVGPLLISNNQRFIEVFKSKQKQMTVSKFLNQSIQYAITYIKRLLKICQAQLFSKEEKASQNNMEKYHKMNKLLKYVNRSTIMPVFDISLGSAKFTTLEKISYLEQQKIGHMFKNIWNDLSEFDSRKLFVQECKKDSLYQKSDLTFTQQEIQKIKLKLCFPKHPRSIKSSQNKYIFNTVEINQKIPINFRKLASGGFGQIQVAEVQYWLLLTISGGKMKKMQEVCQTNNKKTVIKNFLAFKSCNAKGYQSRDRLQHQFKIINRFKGAESPFFCQYFKINNQKSPFNKFLIMEYVHYPTLGQYLKNNLQSISFMTKLHFCNLIGQAIRFLNLYDIVHLDLKPDNILIYKKLMIKLIDFGQSYCPQICSKTFHKPAFSMPYGSPQIFDNTQFSFSQKSDTYSLGVIMFQLFFKRLPYVFSKQKVLPIYKNRLYLQHLYYVPEESIKYGQSEVMKIIQNIMLKCLDPDVQRRPHALWLTLILKQSLNYLINYEIGNFEMDQPLIQNQRQF